MPNYTPPGPPPPPRPRVYHPLAGLLSYLVPGLGQIVQGRVSKGLFFLVSLYGLFFSGMYLGSWKNVYLTPHTSANTVPSFVRSLGSVAVDLWNRPQYLGQFWMGVVSWPALWHYNDWSLPFKDLGKSWKDFELAPDEKQELIPLQTNGDKTWDLGWVYTVIAGVLNILVIYDALAGPALGVGTNPEAQRARETSRAQSEGVPV